MPQRLQPYPLLHRSPVVRVLRHSIFVAVIVLCAFVAFTGHTAWAADGSARISQTVPPATPEPPLPPAPEPTPAPDDTARETATLPPADAAQTPPSTAGAVTADKTATVTAPVLNLRDGPGTTFPVIGKLKSGTIVTVLGRNATGGWLYVCCVPDTETQGWVSAEFVSPTFADADLPVVAEAATAVAPPEPPGTEPPPAIGMTGTVTATVLNVRAGPGTTFSVMGKLKNSATIDVQGRNAAGDWLYMCCIPGADTKGWVSAEFISPTFAAADLPPLADDGTAVAAAEGVAPSVDMTDGRTGTVTATVLNVRSAPGTTSPAVGKLPLDSVIGVLGRNADSDWLYICCVPKTETEGWVSAEYVAPVFPPETLPPLNDDGTPAVP